MTRGRGNSRGGARGHPRGHSTPRGGHFRGRGRGRGGHTNGGDTELEREVEALTRSLGLSAFHDSPSRGSNRGLPQFRGTGTRGRPHIGPSFDDNSFMHSPSRANTKFNKHQRGRGSSISSTPRGSGSHTPLRGGFSTPRKSRIDFSNRPFLKPVVFVRSETVLFKNEDEIFKPEIIDIEVNDVPTADLIEERFAPRRRPSTARTHESLETSDSEEDDDDNGEEQHVGIKSRALPAFIESFMHTAFTSADVGDVPVLDWMAMEEDDLTTPNPTKDITVNSQSSTSHPSDPPLETAINAASSTPNHFDSLPELNNLRTHELPSSPTPSVPPEPLFIIDTTGDLPVPVDDADPQLIEARVSLIAETTESLFVIDTEGTLETTALLEKATETTIPNPSPPILLQTKSADAQEASPPLGTLNLEDDPLFMIDTEGKHAKGAKNVMIFYRHSHAPALGEKPAPVSTRPQTSLPLAPIPPQSSQPKSEDDADDVVVFMPLSTTLPTSRAGKTVSIESQTHATESRPVPASSVPPTISFADLSFKGLKPPPRNNPVVAPTLSASPYVLKAKNRKAAKKENRARKRRAEREAMKGKGLFGLANQTAPRVGDSDLEWGSDGPPGSSTLAKGKGRADTEESDNEVDADEPDMDVDPELQLDDETYARFLDGVMNGPGTVHVSIGDLEDIERMKVEDKESEGRRGSSDEDMSEEDESATVDEDDVAVEADESRLLGEDDDESEIDDDSSSDEYGGTFQERLERARKLANRTPVGRPSRDSDDDDDSDDDELFGGQFKWADEDEEDHIQNVLDGTSRKQRKAIFRAVENGDFEADEIDEIFANNMRIAAGKKKNKNGQHLPPELRDQWQRDRAKKADYKKARAEARKAAELDPFPVRKSGKKKDKFGNRLKLVASSDVGDDLSYRPDGPIKPIDDLISLTEQIRVFINDLSSRQAMTLPPMEKKSRARVHLIAECFKLKSKSIGKGGDRYTTLIKTSKSGLLINEKKLAGILKGRGAGDPFAKAHDKRGGAGAGGGTGSVARHREGEVVGHKAAKIADSNVGYMLLQRMGWSEGQKIGVTGGLADPLTAVIKNTKLGLGAAGPSR